MMPPQRFQLGEWMPDRPDYPNPGAIEIRNALPQAQSYREFRSFSSLSDDATEVILNAIWTDVSGIIEIIAGTATRLLRLNGTAWSIVGSGYSVTSWEFAQFGDNVVAVAPGLTPQIIDLSAGSPSFSAIVGTPENPPNARRVGVVRDFVMLGNLDSNANRIQWSGYNNATIWDANGNTQFQADSQLLFEGGPVQKIVSGPRGYIFQENLVRVADYIGPQAIFNILPNSRARGARSGDAVVSNGDEVFFYAQDGFYRLRGNQFIPIGAERVNQWFLGEIDPNEIDNFVGAVDRSSQLVVWGFKTSGGLTELNRLLFYNYNVDRWAYADTTGEGITNLFELRTTGFTLDQLDTIISGGLDGASASLSVDTNLYDGGSLFLFASDTDGAVGTFSGTAKQAILDTTEFDGPGNTRRSTEAFRPIVEGSGATIQVSVGTRDLLTSTATFSPNEELNVIGEAPILSDARYHRVRLTIEGGFTHASAVDVMSRPSGRF